MTSIGELFPKVRKLAYDAKQQMSQMLHNLLPTSELLLTLDELTRQLDLLEYTLLSREIPAQRLVWKQKIHEMRNEVEAMKKQCDHYQSRIQQTQRHEYERNELMQTRRRRTGNMNLYGSSSEIGINQLADESVSLRNSTTLVADLISIGHEQLSNLAAQRHQMVGVKASLVRIGNRLGLSNSTIRMIERIDVMDFYLVIAGMIITIIVIYVVWFR